MYKIIAFFLFKHIFTAILTDHRIVSMEDRILPSQVLLLNFNKDTTKQWEKKEAKWEQK